MRFAGSYASHEPRRYDGLWSSPMGRSCRCLSIFGRLHEQPTSQARTATTPLTSIKDREAVRRTCRLETTHERREGDNRKNLIAIKKGEGRVTVAHRGNSGRDSPFALDT